MGHSLVDRSDAQMPVIHLGGSAGYVGMKGHRENKGMGKEGMHMQECVWVQL